MGHIQFEHIMHVMLRLLFTPELPRLAAEYQKEKLEIRERCSYQLNNTTEYKIQFGPDTVDTKQTAYIKFENCWT